jgi:KaiC/GvpD/RAD55 family RecA-like ATPase
MTDKTPIGIDFLDRRYGGAFRGRPMLVSGPAKAGKTAAAFHFIQRGLRLRERCLMLTARPAADIVVQADAMGLRFSEAVASGDLILLEYADDVPGRHSEAAITLPPNSFMQLAQIIAEQAVARLALDSCLPWVALKGSDRLEEHVFSFIRSLDRMGVTSLLTMPKAASLAAARLYKLVEAQVPISVTLDYEPPKENRVLIVNKYLGMDDKVGLEIEFTVRPLEGMTEPSAGDSGGAAQGNGATAKQDGSVRFSGNVW